MIKYYLCNQPSLKSLIDDEVPSILVSTVYVINNTFAKCVLGFQLHTKAYMNDLCYCKVPDVFTLLLIIKGFFTVLRA